MRIQGEASRTIWLNDDGWSVSTFDQRLFPHRIEQVRLTDVNEAARAIKDMVVRRRLMDLLWRYVMIHRMQACGMPITGLLRHGLRRLI